MHAFWLLGLNGCVIAYTMQNHETILPGSTVSTKRNHWLPSTSWPNCQEITSVINTNKPKQLTYWRTKKTSNKVKDTVLSKFGSVSNRLGLVVPLLLAWRGHGLIWLLGYPCTNRNMNYMWLHHKIYIPGIPNECYFTAFLRSGLHKKLIKGWTIFKYPGCQRRFLCGYLVNLSVTAVPCKKPLEQSAIYLKLQANEKPG